MGVIQDEGHGGDASHQEGPELAKVVAEPSYHRACHKGADAGDHVDRGEVVLVHAQVEVHEGGAKGHEHEAARGQ